MILVDNSGIVNLDGAADEIMVQGFLAAVSACRVYAKGRNMPLDHVPNMMVNFIRKDGVFAATAGSVNEDIVFTDEAGREEDD